MKKGKEIAVCLVKNTIKKGRDSVSTYEIMKALNVKEVPKEKYELIKTHKLETTLMNKRLIDDWKV